MAYSFEATDSGMVISPLDWSDIENPDKESESRVESPDLHTTRKSSSQISSDLDAERPLRFPRIVSCLSEDDSLSCSPRSNSLRKRSNMMSFRIKKKPIEFILPSGESVELECSGNWTVGEVKDKLWKLLEGSGMLEQSESDLWMVRNEYVLKYHLYGNVYELFDDLQLLQTLKIYPEWLMDRKQSGQVFIVKKKKKTDKDKHCDLDIGYTMGMDLRELSLTSDPELAWTRRVLVSVCEEAVQKRNPQQYAMETDVLSIPPPSHVCKKCPDNNVDLNFFFGPDAAHSSKICFKFDINEKADKIVEEIYIHYSSQGLALGSLDEWTLKVCGYEDYVWGNHSILTFRYVQLCLIKDLPISLTLVKKLDFTIDQLPDVSRVDLVDDNSYLGGTHEQLTATNKNPDDTFIMSMWDINHMFSIKVVGIDGLEIPNIQSKSNSNHELKVGNVFVEAAIYHGGVSLTSNLSSHQQPFKRNVYFKEWLKSNIKVRNIPMAARLCLVVKGFVKNHPVPLYWVNVQLLDHRAVLRCGLIKLPLWPVMEWDSLLNAKEEIVDSGMRPSGSATLNPSPKSPILYIELYSYAHPVACPHSGNPCGDSSALSNPEKKGPPKGSLMERMLLDIIESDALTKLDDQQRDLVETYRHHLCRHYPDALPKYLLAVKWSDLHSVLEVQDLLEKWKQPISLKAALHLLDYHFADENVRCLAVERLEKLHNDELQLYLLQLVQVLKFEPYNDNPLARFLLKRALESKKIGYRFFWFLASELDAPEYRHRFGVLLEAYLRYCGVGMLEELYRQRHATKTLTSIAVRLKQFLESKSLQRGVSGDEFVQKELSTALKSQDLPSFLLHYNSSLRVGKLNIKACKHMTSKKKPLWLEFENVDPSAKSSTQIQIIFKHGDDLRQDMLALQMLMLMERLWHENSLNLYLVPYGCVATSCQEGLIEVVPNAETIARIQIKADEEKSFIERILRNSTLKEDTITEWLKGPLGWRNIIQQDKVVEKFLYSCAGYCIATYVLGIGDRHSDNIMVKSDGNLFHIDFGHFLGNKKYFRVAGQKIKRERVPFVLSPDFVHMMGGKDGVAFSRFREVCSEAYAVLRSQTNLFINLFHMMIPSGMKELSRAQDIDYVKKALCSGLGDKEAKEHIHSQISLCLQDGWKTTVDWWFHRLGQTSPT